MPISEKDVEIVNRYGLHARPAMQLVELANKYSSKIEVSNGTLTVDAKSIMSVMRLAATKGTVLRVTANGGASGEAVEAIIDLIGQFDELDQQQASLE